MSRSPESKPPRGRRRRLHRLSALAVVVFGASTISVPVSLAGQSPSLSDHSTTDSRLCQKPAGTDIERIASLKPIDSSRDKTPWYAEWLDDKTVQAGAEAVSGVTSNSQDVIGTAVDFDAKKLIITIWPSADKSAWKKTVSDAADGRIGVRVETGCYDKTNRELAKNNVMETAKSLGLPNPDISVDVTTGKLILLLDDKATASQMDRLKALPNVAKVEKEHLYGRLNDSDPHYGGSGIRPSQINSPSAAYDSNICTSGFTYMAAGIRWSSTAAHCTEDTYGTTGPFWSSGYNGPYYGVERYVNVSLDAMLVGSSNQFYTRLLHTDPICDAPGGSCTRLVTSKRTYAYVSMPVCTDGMVTRAICGAVTTRQAANGQWIAERPGVIIGRPGDSGAPLFGRDGSDNASARGMLIGGIEPYGDDLIFFNDIHRVEVATGGTLLTSG